jgi:hypothetical protein
VSIEIAPVLISDSARLFCASASSADARPRSSWASALS